jgi:hypothetical protein
MGQLVGGGGQFGCNRVKHRTQHKAEVGGLASSKVRNKNLAVVFYPR